VAQGHRGKDRLCDVRVGDHGDAHETATAWALKEICVENPEEQIGM
jgi:hypothetical protein